MLAAINEWICDKQNQPLSCKKWNVFTICEQKWPNVTMHIRDSDMKFVCQSDGSYLSKSDSRPRAGGILFLGDCGDNDASYQPVSFLSVIIKTVVTSATATEYAVAFIVGRAAISKHHGRLGIPIHNLKATEIYYDNLRAVRIANNSLNFN
jgi:hypothetical protein